MQNILREVLEESKVIAKTGQVASYIPALLKANPNHIGICVIDSDGRIYKEGDCDVKFTIQSISKVPALILALMDNGEKVFEKVGREGRMNPLILYISLICPILKNL